MTIDIDDALLAEAMAARGYPTQVETVEAGLRLLIRLKRQASMRDLFGAVAWDGDLHAERLDDPEPPTR